VTDTGSSDLRERLVAMTRDLVLIPSSADRPDDRRRCYELVKNHLDSVRGVRVSEMENESIPSLLALPKNCEAPQVLMCAHLDVIAHPDISFYRSEIRDGRIIGPGTGDMKGALAILMDVFRDIHERRPGASLGLVVTSDEETGGERGIGHLFQQRGLRCGTAMIPDGGSLNEITTDEKGILHLRVRCHGRPAHAARPWLGENPIQHLMQACQALLDRFASWQQPDTHWYPTCALTSIGTENQTVNRVPSDAHAVLDVRFPPPHTVASMLRYIRQSLGPRVDVDVIISAEATHLAPDALYRQVTEEVTGQPALLGRDCGGSDARFLCAQGIPVQMSRPHVGNLHAPDEWIDIESMVQFHHICATYVKRRLDRA